MAHILIIEDDPDIASLLTRGLESAGHSSAHAFDRISTVALLDQERFDGAIIDMMLGPESGATILRNLREQGFSWPALCLSALSRIEERAEGLMAGAQDYIVKPFQISELLARLEVQLLRHPARAAPRRFGDMIWHADKREVKHANCADPRPVILSEREADLLTYLLKNQGELRSRGEIFDTLWAPLGSSTDNVVDVYIGYLRRKLRDFAPYGLQLQTLRGRGFALVTRTPQTALGEV